METKNVSNIVKIILISGILNLNLMATPQEELKKETLILGQAAFFLNTNGPDPFINVLKPDIDEVSIIKCGCKDPETETTRHIKNTDDLQNICVLDETVNGFGGNYKSKKKYAGERKSIIGKALDIISDEYPGTILIDEYKKNIPMFWVLKNVDELRAIFTYMAKKFEEEKFSPTKKNLLVLKIQNDPTLETLSKDEKTFLDAYFEVFPLTDKDVKEFFEQNKRLMLDMNNNIGRSNPKYIGETAIQSITRQTEKFYKDFEAKHIIILIGVFVTTKIILDFISNEIADGRKMLIQNTTGDTKSSSFLGAFINKRFAKNTA